MFKLPLPELLFLTTMVATGCAWWLQRLESQEQRRIATHWRSMAFDERDAIRVMGRSFEFTDENGKWVDRSDDEFMEALGSSKPTLNH